MRLSHHHQRHHNPFASHHNPFASQCLLWFVFLLPLPLLRLNHSFPVLKFISISTFKPARKKRKNVLFAWKAMTLLIL